MRAMVLFLALAVFLGSCTELRATPEMVSPTSARADPEEIERAEQDIYRFVASQFCDEGVVYIHPEVALYPGYDSDIERAHSELPDMAPETWESYQLVNDPAQQVTPFSDFPVDCSYEFASSNTQGCYTGESTCIAPYGFSQIGFDQAGTQALVYMYKDCPECAGWGALFLLEKNDGVWRIIDSVELWFS